MTQADDGQTTTSTGRGAPDANTAKRGTDLLDAVTVSAALTALVVVAVGLGAALAGVMTPAVVGGLVLFTGILVGAVVVRSGVFSPFVWRMDIPSIGAIIVTAGFSLVSMQYASEHLLADRDPGVYVTTARWLASRGTLLIDGAVGAFAGVDGIDGVSAGYYAANTDGFLYAQFQHGLAVILAVGHWIGGDWLLLKSVGLLSGLVIAAFYVLGRLVLRPWWAFAATVGLAVNLVTLHFGRDAYSEILFMIFLFGGLWLLDRALDTGRPDVSLLAGIVIGGTALARIDAWMILAGLFAFLFFDMWSAGPDWRRRIAKVSAPVVIGAVTMGLLGTIDLMIASPEYLSDLTPNLYRIAAVLAIVIGLGLLASVLTRPWRWIEAKPVIRRRQIVANVVGTLIVVGSAFLYFIRPEFLVERSLGATEVIEYLQRLQGLPADGSRRYWEMSMQWQAWYLGAGGLTIGVLGWAWTAREVVAGRLRRLAPFLFIFSLVTVAFLWRPANTPDHLWMMRRFLAVTIPGFLLLGTVGLQSLTAAVKARSGRPAAAAVAVALLVVVVVPPAAFSGPLARSTTQVGMYGVTRDVCAALGDDAAVLFVSHELRSWYEPAVRSFCEIPVAGAAGLPDPATLEQVDSAWRESGRTLFVASLPIEGCGITPVYSEFIWYPSPERTLTRRPAAQVDTRFGIALYRAADVVAEDPGAWTRCAGPVQ